MSDFKLPVTTRIFTRPDFVNAVIEASSQLPTYRAAFEYVNDIHEEITGHPRYESYESFRNAKHHEQRKTTPPAGSNSPTPSE